LHTMVKSIYKMRLKSAIFDRLFAYIQVERTQREKKCINVRKVECCRLPLTIRYILMECASL